MEPIDRKFREVLAGLANAEHSSTPAPLAAPARILIAASEKLLANASLEVVRRLLVAEHTFIRAATLPDALNAVASDRFDVVLVDAHLPGANNALEQLQQSLDNTPAVKTIMLTGDLSAGAVIRAMRCGAIDCIALPCPSGELAERIQNAANRAQRDREREERIIRLREICNQLNIARQEIGEQVDLLCSDLAWAYQEMNAQVSEAAMASEFRTLIRQELDVEDLLRTALEYFLTKTGPTNAAVFLPEGGGTFALGAYVNYDCPRQTIAPLLDGLCVAVCNQMLDEPEIVSFEDAADFADWLDIEAAELGESQVISFTCRHDEETLAIFVLFRSKSSPFSETLGEAINILRPIFAEQLSRVITVHHRSRPSWPSELPDDELDFLDPPEADGFGFGQAA